MFKIDIFSLDNRDLVLKNIKNTGKTLFIEDVANPESLRGDDR
jgi:hypothetical protein